jgi:hypothetical protein
MILVEQKSVWPLSLWQKPSLRPKPGLWLEPSLWPKPSLLPKPSLVQLINNYISSYAGESQKAPTHYTMRKTSPVQGDQKIRKKLPNFSKNSSKSCQVKKAKISTTKLNLKAQNIYKKPLLKP